MRHVLLTGLALALTLSIPLAFAQDVAGGDHAEHGHNVIRISNGRLHPSEIRVSADEALAWLNYSRYRARISFDASVAEKLVCTSRSSFQLDDDRLVSGEIQGTQFASLCQLAPGTYTYRVEFFNGLGYPPERQIEGSIRVDG